MRIDAERAGATRDEYQRALAAEQIGTSIHFLPVHRLAWYRERFPDQRPLAVAERAGGTRDEYQRLLAEENIGTSIHFLPVHRLSWYRERFPDQPPLPVAERAGDEVLSLPLSPAHAEDDIADAIEAIRRVHARLTG